MRWENGQGISMLRNHLDDSSTQAHDVLMSVLKSSCLWFRQVSLFPAALFNQMHLHTCVFCQLPPKGKQGTQLLPRYVFHIEKTLDHAEPIPSMWRTIMYSLSWTIFRYEKQYMSQNIFKVRKRPWTTWLQRHVLEVKSTIYLHTIDNVSSAN